MAQRKLKNTAYSTSELNAVSQGLEKYFHHHWGFIVASNPKYDDGKKPKWSTETKFKLNNKTLLRRFVDPDSLVGVRFDTNEGSVTNYFLLDDDFLSRVHPTENPELFSKLIDTFEEEGFVSPTFVQSSYSKGLHIYFALSEAVDTFSLACLIKRIVERLGIKPESGQLELFPNCKYYNKNQVTNYNAHRLPLQPNSGSYLLDDDLNLISDDFCDFIAQMDFSAKKNIVDEEFREKLQMAKESVYQERLGCFNFKNKSKVAIWKADLEFAIKLGWTGRGQTNELLRIIATYGVVFLGLEGERLYQYLLATVLNAPGYGEYCGHHDDIERRCRERAKNAEKYYWKLGSTPKREIDFKDAFGKDRDGVVNGNENTKLNTIQRLKAVLEAIKKSLDTIPKTKTAFLKFLMKKSEEIFKVGFSFATLKKATYTALWMPVLSLVIESQAIATVEEIETIQPQIEAPLVEIQIETEPQKTEAIPPQKEASEPETEITSKTTETPVKPSNYTPLEEKTKSESLESLQDKGLHTLPYMKVFERNSKPQKNSSPDLQPGNLISPRSPSKSPQPINKANQLTSGNPRPTLKNGDKQDLSAERIRQQQDYYAELQKLHNDIKRLEDERKTPEYQNTAREGFTAIYEILDRAKAKSKRGTPSPPT